MATSGKRDEQASPASARSLLQLNDINVFLFRRRSYPAYCFGSRAVKRAVVTGPTPGRGGPLTPRPRGTNYEAMPSIPKRMKELPITEMGQGKKTGGISGDRN